MSAHSGLLQGFPAHWAGGLDLFPLADTIWVENVPTSDGLVVGWPKTDGARLFRAEKAFDAALKLVYLAIEFCHFLFKGVAKVSIEIRHGIIIVPENFKRFIGSTAYYCTGVNKSW